MMLSTLPSTLFFLLLTIILAFSATATYKGKDVCTADDCVMNGVTIEYVVGNVACDPTGMNCVETCVRMNCSSSLDLSPEPDETPPLPLVPEVETSPLLTSTSSEPVDCNTADTTRCTTSLQCTSPSYSFAWTFENLSNGWDVDVVTFLFGSLTGEHGDVESMIECTTVVECLKQRDFVCFTWTQTVVIDAESCSFNFDRMATYGAFRLDDPTVISCKPSGGMGKTTGMSMGMKTTGKKSSSTHKKKSSSTHKKSSSSDSSKNSSSSDSSKKSSSSDSSKKSSSSDTDKKDKKDKKGWMKGKRLR